MLANEQLVKLDVASRTVAGLRLKRAVIQTAFKPTPGANDSFLMKRLSIKNTRGKTCLTNCTLEKNRPHVCTKTGFIPRGKALIIVPRKPSQPT